MAFPELNVIEFNVKHNPRLSILSKRLTFERLLTRVIWTIFGLTKLVANTH